MSASVVQLVSSRPSADAKPQAATAPSSRAVAVPDGYAALSGEAGRVRAAVIAGNLQALHGQTRRRPDAIDPMAVRFKCAMGGLLGGLATMTSVTVAAHERLGHLFLGGLVYNYPEGCEPVYYRDVPARAAVPTWQTNFIDSYRYSSNGVMGVLSGMMGLAPPAPPEGYEINTGASGWAKVSGGNIGMSALGQLFGPSGSWAWVSLSGTLPTLGACLALAWVGARLAHARSAPSAALSGLCAGYALTQYAFSVAYPWSSLAIADWSHGPGFSSDDFVNWAKRIADLSGYTEGYVAWTTALLATVAPLAAAFVGFSAPRQDLRHHIPDSVALCEWLANQRAVQSPVDPLTALLEKYPHLAALDAANGPQLAEQLTRVNSYLCEALAGAPLQGAKDAILTAWYKHPVSRPHAAWRAAADAGLLAGFAMPVARVLGATLVPELLTLSRTLTSPWFYPVFPALNVALRLPEVLTQVAQPTSVVSCEAKIYAVIEGAAAVGVLATSLWAAMAWNDDDEAGASVAVGWMAALATVEVGFAAAKSSTIGAAICKAQSWLSRWVAV